MREYSIDLSGVTDREGLHRRLREDLSLPDWYGNNLDALHDVLADLPDPTLVRISGWEGLQKALPAYYSGFVHVLNDVSAVNEAFAFHLVSGPDSNTEKEAERNTERNMKESRTLIITDIHGCYDECLELLHKMEFDEEADTLINLGDIIDRGPKIYETFVFLRDLQERMGERCIMIRGNHEQMMLDTMAEGGRSRDLWYYNSGEKTVYSFLHHKHKIQEFLAWFEKMPYYYVTERFSCVHACLIDQDPARNEVQTLIWGRDTNYKGKLVMTGHTPYRMPIYFVGDQYGEVQEDIWTRLPENGMIALDTGCVYGNRLTGMIIREDGAFKVTSVASGVKRQK